MKTLGVLLAGVAAGWVVRSTVDSSRDLTVAALAAAYELADRARRFAAVEREHLEDLLAESRTRYEANRARRAARTARAAGAGNGAAPHATAPAPARHERAA